MTDIDMNAKDFPEVFQTFDEAAIRNQRAHFRSMKCELVLLLAISIIGSLTWGPFVGLESSVLFVIAVLLVLVIVLAAFRCNRRFDHTWFACRAVAESVKPESWKYMMNVDP